LAKCDLQSKKYHPSDFDMKLTHSFKHIARMVEAMNMGKPLGK
jgi:hypothetical protein